MKSALFKSVTSLVFRPPRTTSCVRKCQSIALSLHYQRHAFTTGYPCQAKNKNKNKNNDQNSSGITSETSAAYNVLLESAVAEAKAANDSAVERLNKKLKDLKAGKQDPSKLRNLKIPGEDTILSTLAAVTQKNPKTFLVTVFDPAHVKQISSAIASSGQNFNPQPVPNNPTQLSINIPAESSLNVGLKTRQANELAVKTKDDVRHARGNAIRAIRATKAPSDQMTLSERQVHDLTKGQNNAIDKLVEDAKKALCQ